MDNEINTMMAKATLDTLKLPAREKLTIRKLKSLETGRGVAYTAELMIDGKKAGTIENRGNGGCTELYPHTLADRLVDIAAECGLGEEHLSDHDSAEALAELLITRFELDRDLTKKMATRIMFFTQKWELFSTKPLKAPDLTRLLAPANRPQLIRQLQAETVLNVLPFDLAARLFTTEQAKRQQEAA